MAKKNESYEEQILRCEADIEKCKQKLAELKVERKRLIAAKEKRDIDSIISMIQESGKDVGAIKQVLASALSEKAIPEAKPEDEAATLSVNEDLISDQAS